MNDLSACLLVLSFAEPASLTVFHVINDGVMGGISSSQISHEHGALVFEGKLSLANNGGFASFRGPVDVPPTAQALIVSVHGDGKRYKLVLKPADGALPWQYQAPFHTDGTKQWLRFTLADFTARFRGRPVDAPPLKFGQMGGLGMLISDRQAGSFRIRLHEVRAE